MSNCNGPKQDRAQAGDPIREDGFRPSKIILSGSGETCVHGNVLPWEVFEPPVNRRKLTARDKLELVTALSQGLASLIRRHAPSDLLAVDLRTLGQISVVKRWAPSDYLPVNAELSGFYNPLRQRNGDRLSAVVTLSSGVYLATVEISETPADLISLSVETSGLNLQTVFDPQGVTDALGVDIALDSGTYSLVILVKSVEDDLELDTLLDASSYTLAVGAVKNAEDALAVSVTLASGAYA